jgi:hypothetical protein
MELVASDGCVFQVPDKLVRSCVLLKNMSEDTKGEQVHLPNVSSSMMGEILKFHMNSGCIQKVTVELLNAVDFIGYELMFDSLCRQMADSLRDKSVTEIRTILEL